MLLQTAAQVVDAEETIELSEEATKAFTLHPGTALAFNVCELLVQQDGSLELLIERDCQGGFQVSSSETGSLLSCGRG